MTPLLSRSADVCKRTRHSVNGWDAPATEGATAMDGAAYQRPSAQQPLAHFPKTEASACRCIPSPPTPGGALRRFHYIDEHAEPREEWDCHFRYPDNIVTLKEKQAQKPIQPSFKLWRWGARMQSASRDARPGTGKMHRAGRTIRSSRMCTQSAPLVPYHKRLCSRCGRPSRRKRKHMHEPGALKAPVTGSAGKHMEAGLVLQDSCPQYSHASHLPNDSSSAPGTVLRSGTDVPAGSSNICYSTGIKPDPGHPSTSHGREAVSMDEASPLNGMQDCKKPDVVPLAGKIVQKPVSAIIQRPQKAPKGTLRVLAMYLTHPLGLFRSPKPAYYQFIDPEAEDGHVGRPRRHSGEVAKRRLTVRNATSAEGA